MKDRRLGGTAGRASVIGLVLFACAPVARAQAPAPLPPVPTRNPAAPAPSRESALEQRLRKLEEDNRQILEMYKAISKQNADLSKKLEAVTAPKGREEGGGTDDAGSGDRTADGTEDGTGTATGELSQRTRRGVGAQGTDARTFEPEGRYREREKVPRRKALVEFAEGLEFSSDDGEFKLQFHDLTQAELRTFPLNNTGFLHTSFFIPRQRWYFTGRVTKNLEFYTVINRGYGTLDLLDAFLTYRYDPGFRFRIGRMKTPYLYEYYQIAEGDLIAPERSLFAGNLAPNREIGAMFLGELFKNRAGYAVGVFNGDRRSFEDTNNAKDVFFFLNTRPFLEPTGDGPGRGTQGTGGRTRPNQALPESAGPDEPGPLEYLNIGGSFNAGSQMNPATPLALRTANDQSSAPAAGVLSPTFFQFNNDVIANGERLLWAAHIAYYYRSLFVLAEYAGGFGSYSFANQHTSTRVPFEGYMAQASYFLTGERITRRVNVVKPLRDFRIRDGKVSGTGAVEVYGRYSYFNIGRDVFTSGFSDPNNWTNQAYTTDIGVNWYLNFYTKIYFDWQYAGFGNDVLRNSSGGRSKATNLFWLRFQLFF